MFTEMECNLYNIFLSYVCKRLILSGLQANVFQEVSMSRERHDHRLFINTRYPVEETEH